MLYKILQNFFSKKNYTRAFTLVEMSVIILIIGLIVGAIFGGTTLIKKYQQYADTKKIRETYDNKSFKKDLKFGFSFDNLKNLKNGDEITKIIAIDEKDKKISLEVVNDEQLKEAYGEDIDVSQFKNPTYSNSVCGAPSIKFGNFGEKTRPLKASQKINLTNDYLILISLSLNNPTSNENIISKIISNKLCPRNCNALSDTINKENCISCQNKSERLEYEIPKSGGTSFFRISANKENAPIDNEGELIENASCGNVIALASYTENGKKIKKIYVNNMEVSHNAIDLNQTTVDYNNGNLYIGEWAFPQSEISKLLIYSKSGMNREYVKRKMRDVKFPRGRKAKKRARKDKISTELQPSLTRSGYFFHERIKNILNRQGQECREGIVKKNLCIKDFCVINQAILNSNGQLELDPNVTNNRFPFIGLNVKVPLTQPGQSSYLGCYSATENKYTGSTSYTCTKSGNDAIIKFGNNKCKCNNEGYAWSRITNDCEAIKCKIPREDFTDNEGNNIDDCIDELLNNQKLQYLTKPYTGGVYQQIETNDNCNGNIKYRCQNSGYSTEIDLKNINLN